jgi:hypothetical protein
MIILKRQDGHISIMTLVEGSDKEEAVRKFKEQHEGYVEHFEVSDDIELPSREFRDAWEFKDNKIVINQEKV